MNFEDLRSTVGVNDRDKFFAHLNGGNLGLSPCMTVVETESYTIQVEEATGESTEETYPLHKVFIDLALENDIKGEELEWFRSKIFPQKFPDEKDKLESEAGKAKVQVQYEVEKPAENENKVLLRLTETETIWFWTSESHFSQENEEDAERVRLENEAYQMKKTKKEITRKRWMADAQTPRFMVKSRETLTSDIVMVDKQILASDWDMYDTYNGLDKCEKKVYKDSFIYVDKVKDEVVNPISTEADTAKLFNQSNFKYASLVTERLLASNCLQSKQSVFKKDYKTRYYTGPTEFNYKIETLWNFQKDLERPLTITGLDFNPINQVIAFSDILAVAYGDINFEKGCLGLICVWSAKNPRQPERNFWFDDSVTSLHYSRLRPNILAVGTRSGNVFVLDVSIQEGKRRILGRDCLKVHPGPVWKVEWFLREELMSETEEILAVGESGVLMVFSTETDKDTTDVLKLDYVTSTQKLPEKINRKLDRPPVFHSETYDKKTFSGLSFSIYYDRKFCYISTKEGVLVKCNLRNPSMTDGVFLAHNGPVFAIQHSPVTDLFYLTCGADWKIKIWMEGINQPLITLQDKGPVACAGWSPTIPTLIATVGQSELSLWDFGRNVLSPVAVKKFDDCKKSLSSLLFSSNGANVMIGCEEGLVRVVHLSELPRIPFLQKEALLSAIKRVLLRNKDELFLQFCKAVEANRDKLKTKVTENLND